MLLGTINLLPGVRYSLLNGLWTNFIVFNCQVVERGLIFANPVFINSGINILQNCTLVSYCILWIIKQFTFLCCGETRHLANDGFETLTIPY